MSMNAESKRERACQCQLCPAGHTTWNRSALCDRHARLVPHPTQITETVWTEADTQTAYDRWRDGVR